MDERTLTRLSDVLGVTCAAIGAAHVASGLDGLPGRPGGDASLDSQKRFFGAIFAGYGLVWMLAARRRPPDLLTVDILNASMLAGGVAGCGR